MGWITDNFDLGSQERQEAAGLHAAIGAGIPLLAWFCGAGRIGTVIAAALWIAYAWFKEVVQEREWQRCWAAGDMKPVVTDLVTMIVPAVLVGLAAFFLK